MILQVNVDGFRSLKGFELALLPGLNVLVGPNGAGKTNIILFFEFMHLVCESGVTHAISRMGGAGNIFQKRGKQKFSDRIDFSVIGSVVSDGHQYRYTYSAGVKASVAAQDLFFYRQSLVIKSEDGSDYLNVAWVANGDDADGGVVISQYPDEEESNGRMYLNRDDIKKYLKVEFLLDHALVNFFQHALPVTDGVNHDLSSRFLLNVVPTVVKNPEDSTRQPGIDSDGSGLSSTLFAIKKKRAVPDGVGRSFFRRSEQKLASWARVISQIKVAVPTIEDVDVENDPFDNKLRVRVTVGKGNNRAILPLSALSDGTVKWMSLVVRLATSRAALLLEEPENYLHPLMQQEVVRLLRDSVMDGGFVMLSTHSETLLNAVRVEELVVISYRNGATRACRVKNVEELNREIASTGFGLGYYYLADAIRS